MFDICHVKMAKQGGQKTFPISFSLKLIKPVVLFLFSLGYYKLLQRYVDIKCTEMEFIYTLS